MLTFYPQPLLNHRRKRVSGLSLEFVLYQFTGFLCYSLYSIVSYILQVEHEADGDVSVAVRPNDIAFAVHALLLTTVVLVQYRMYAANTRTLASVSPVHRYVLFGLWLLLAFSLVLALTGSIAWSCISQSASACPTARLNLLSLLGYAKIAVNLVKNIPQLLLNHSRRSTVGWSIQGVLLDVGGSVLAFGQQVLDAWNLRDGGMVWGNVPKLLLSVLSFAFDMLFLLQHYVWYRGGDEAGKGAAEEGLLGDEANGETAEPRGGGVADDEESAGSVQGGSDGHYERMADEAINSSRLPT